MAAPKEMLDQVDGSADSLLESMGEVQTTMVQLHSSVSVLLNSMSEILKSMAEMKAALQHTTTTTESRVTVEQQDLPAADNNPVEEKKEEPSRYAYSKRIEVEMPVFEGLNVNLWILKAERYFEFGDFTEAEKLRVLYASVDGRALNWFILSDRLQPFVDWDDFKSRLLDRFGHSDCATTRLLALKQVESVLDYLGQFEELTTQLPADTSNFFTEKVFVSGLKDEIKDMFPLFQPKGLNEIISLARRLERSRFFGRLMNIPPPPDDDSSLTKLND